MSHSPAKLKVGIFFGGPSREREISFAGGRTVYDNLDKSIFEPIPIFVDSNQTLILLDWQYIYKGTIRDFYPPVDFIPESPYNYQLYVENLDLEGDDYLKMIKSIGQPIGYGELYEQIDFAFLALHGAYGEDGILQSILQSMDIPYSGSGPLACSIGINKAVQKKLMQQAGYTTPAYITISKQAYQEKTIDDIYELSKNKVAFPLVIRPANQGSSIGVSILMEDDKEKFNTAVRHAFFEKVISSKEWNSLKEEDQVEYVRDISDIRSGLGFPLYAEGNVFFHPEALLYFLRDYFKKGSSSIHLVARDAEQEIIIEAFIKGKEFSCVVIKDRHSKTIALPPTEIIKQTELYDYRSKYLPGLSRKLTPIDLPTEAIESIRKECSRLFEFLSFDVYARIDGFFTPNGDIILNDPNTTSGMLPSSFFFHQAAEIGMNPSQFTSYIIGRSIQDRIAGSNQSYQYEDVLYRLDQLIQAKKSNASDKLKVGVILGGYSFERHISVESGRNIYEKLSSSEKYEAIPLFCHKTKDDYTLYHIPINYLLKDNADDIASKIDSKESHEIIELIRNETVELRDYYTDSKEMTYPKEILFSELSDLVDRVFIALHGRPGEDGDIQKRLDDYGIPYNGSGTESSQITINKYDTGRYLSQEGFEITKQLLVDQLDYASDKKASINAICSKLGLPLILKPVDDGCSSAVMLIKTKDQMTHYLDAIFRTQASLDKELRNNLGISPNEEFPAKNQVLAEQLIEKQDANDFLEITCGLLTHLESDGSIRYEIFEPSEALATGEVLSLEEKFLAGEGQNITPARLGNTEAEYKTIANQIKQSLEKAAKLLDIKGYARIDAFVRIYENLKVETVIIEVNSLPGMTPATCIFHQAAINGYPPLDFIDKILDFAALDKSLHHETRS